MIGSGTSTDPYIISTVDDLLLIKDDLAGYYELAADITMDWQEGSGWAPLATPTHPFAGVFDGKGHKIIDLYINRPSTTHIGFFASVSGSVKNIEFVNARVTGGQYSSIVTGSVNTNDNAGTSYFNNIKVQGSIKAFGNYAGGIIGGHGCAVEFENNYGEVDIDLGASITYVGGLIGSVGSDATTGFIRNCTFSGILGRREFDYQATAVGGIAGYSFRGISNCTVKGMIYGAANLGGIVGQAPTGAGIPGGDIYDNSVTASLKGSGNNVGGIVGNCVAHRVFRNTSSANITSTGTPSNYGGIVGYFDGTSNAYYCSFNEFYGLIQLAGGTAIGGIIGRTHHYSYIEGNLNYGELNTSANYVAGIVGYGDSHRINHGYDEDHSAASTTAPFVHRVFRCVNFGKVKGSSYVGGISGDIGGPHCTNNEWNPSSYPNWTSGRASYIYYCMNFGPIYGTTYAAGINGYSHQTQIRFCVNAQKENQAKTHAITAATGYGSGYSINYSSLNQCQGNYQINWGVTFLGTTYVNATVSGSAAVKQASFPLLDFVDQFCIVEGEELPRPQKAGRYSHYNFVYTFPVDISDEVAIGDAFDVTYIADWSSAITFKAIPYLYTGSAWRRIEGKVQFDKTPLVMPLDVTETYAAYIRIVFWTSDKMYFCHDSNPFHVVGMVTPGLIFVDEFMCPYNRPDGSVFRNIRFSNLFLNSLSASRKIFVYNFTDTAIARTLITVDNTTVENCKVLLGSRDGADFEAVEALTFDNMQPHEIREIFLKVQTFDTPTEALIPVKLYASQTVVA